MAVNPVPYPNPSSSSFSSAAVPSPFYADAVNIPSTTPPSPPPPLKLARTSSVGTVVTNDARSLAQRNEVGNMESDLEEARGEWERAERELLAVKVRLKGRRLGGRF